MDKKWVLLFRILRHLVWQHLPVEVKVGIYGGSGPGLIEDIEDLLAEG